MLFRILAVPLVVLAVTSTEATADGLPAIKLSTSNTIPACATPGRLSLLLTHRNPDFDTKFKPIAKLYRQHGQELGVRWDYAFFQMIVETGALKFRRGNGGPSDVRPAQNNFAGLGATGKGEPGESFDSLSEGVKAHLQHLLLYAGAKVENPVAERTRNVQSWGILSRWQKGLGRPTTFRDLAKKWAPGSRGYARDIAGVGAQFYDSFCSRADPDPGAATVQVSAAASGGSEGGTTKVERKRVAALPEKSGLGAVRSEPQPSAEVLNPAAVEVNAADAAASDVVALPTRKPIDKAIAIAAATRKPETETKPSATKTAKKKCRVWTASYGGQKAVLIRADTDQFTNYTVLDVNAGKEQREAAAYIAAYAKGGQKVADFSTQTQALNKAFELCPEG